MSRREAREFAFLLLYQMEIRKSEPSEQREIFLQEYPLDEADTEYFDRLISGIAEKQAEVDELYSPLLKGWKIDRLPKVDVILLRIASYEIKFCEDVPVSVSISEAVVLAKKYSTEESKAYINAILGRIDAGPKK